MRLLTRSDFDGLACAALLKATGVIEDIKFVHPKDLQDGLIEVSGNDILANVPYVHGCGLWFDHHESEKERLGNIVFKGESRLAPSAARIIYEYYGGENRFPGFTDMIPTVDLVDSGNLTREQILHPTGYILLGFVMDPRTGLGRFRNFTISNYQLMEKLIDACATMTIDEILALPDVKERLDLYEEQQEKFIEMVRQNTTVHGNLIVTDLRDRETIYAGNRFLIYSLYPEQNISIWIVDGRAKQNCVFATGHSILNRTNKTDVGSLMLRFGGGGHHGVGTCQVPYADAETVLQTLIERITADG